MTRKPRKILTQFLFENILDFREYLSKNNINEYIDLNIKTYGKFGVKSSEDVFSLLLNISIELFDLELIKNILNSNYFDHKKNILITLDKNNLCPLYVALTSNKEILDLLQDYIKKYEKNFYKYEIPEGDFKKIAYWIPLIPNDYSTSDNFHNLIEPLYSESSINNLIKHIGEEIFDINNYL